METYDPAKVTISFLAQIIRGFVDGTFIEVERMSEGWTSYAGAGGDVARVRQNDKRGTFTLTLMHTHPSNDILSAAAVLDELDGSALGPIFVKDNTGRMMCAAPNAWIRKIPKAERGKEISGVQWVIDCDVLDIFVGGN